MKKVFFIFGVLVSLFILAFVGLVVSAQVNGSENSSDGTQEVLGNVFEGTQEVPERVSDYVLGFVQKRGVSPSEVSLVREVDFESLPKDVNIKGVGDHNLAIYEISYDENGKEDQVYVVSYSTEKIRKQGDLIVSQDKRNFLNFGFSGEMPSSGFLKTASDVETSLEKGYVMMRKGSITAVSTNLEIIDSTSQGEIKIIVYVNGKEVSFGNRLSTESSGVKKDYDSMSKGVVTFNEGDVISVEVEGSTSSSWGDITTLIEITTEN
ncbi:MAG: hypothetical protein WDZ62_00090 [Candidatus Pacearchaeota archaeon]